MTAIKTLTAVAAAALTLAAAGVASAQTPYNQTPYSPQSQQPSQGSVLEAILGSLFGSGQTTLDAEWSRGRRPLLNQRAAFESRLDAGVRDGSLPYSHATQLRADYADLVQLETRYAADRRFTTEERRDLTARYNNLNRHLEADSDGYGDNHGGYGDDRWEPLSGQHAAFDARIDAALRDRRISSRDASRLRADFDALVRIEYGYQRNGIDARERQDLQTRWADLNRRVGDNYDYDYGYGSGGHGADPRAIQIEARITAGERDGSISRSEAARLRDELRDLTRRWADLEARVQQARR